MNREVLDRWCEKGILGLVLAILVFGPLATGAVRPQDFLIIQGLTIGVMFLWLLRLWIKSDLKLLWPPVTWAVLAFGCYAIARYFTSDLEYITRSEVVQVWLYVFLFLVIVNNLHRQEHTQLIIFTLVFLAMAIAAYALYQFAKDSDKVWTLIKPYPHRGSGTFISPNNLAGFLEMVLPLGLATLLVSRAKPASKIFVAYASLVMLGGILVTLSRGGWAAVSLELIVLFGVLLGHRNYRIPAALLLVVFIGAGVFLIPKANFVKVRLAEPSGTERLHENTRFDLWQPAVRLWRENVWWGIGPNHYNYRFRAFRPQSEQQQPDRVHNDYLNTLTDWGVVGVVLVSSAWILLYGGVFRTWRFVRGNPGDLGGGNSNKFALVLGASLGLFAILAHSVVDFNMHIPANAILAVSLMAMLASTIRFSTEKFWFTARLAAKLGLSLMLLAGLGCLGWLEIRGIRESVWLERANRLPEFSSEQVQALQQAFEVEPYNFETAYRIGEALRRQSWEGASDYEETARQAIRWFDLSLKLNPYDGTTAMRIGSCLDWLGKPDEAGPHFERAVKLDPNGYFVAGWMGWHYVQTGDYAAAKTWFERSRRLEWKGNDLADTYLPIVNERLLDQAQNPVDALQR